MSEEKKEAVTNEAAASESAASEAVANEAVTNEAAVNEAAANEAEQPEQTSMQKQRNATRKGLKRAGYVAACVAAVLLIAGVGTSVGMNVVLMQEMNAQNTKVSRFIDDERARQAKESEQENTYQEDGFVVMDQYEIRSTTNISDAYLKNDPSGLGSEDKETYDMAKTVLDQIIRDGMTDYEKELAIYDWMVDNIGHGSGHTISMPGQSAQAFTPYGVLKGKNAVCVGYATTFRLLANMVGLDVHIVHNDYHSWDMVKLDDGEWYQLDIYSDSQGAKYRNFNMTDEMARNGHDWDGSALPEAKGTKYSYAVQNAKELKDLFEVPAEVRAAFDQKGASLFFKFPKTLSEQDMALADQMMIVMQQAMYALPGAESKDLSAAWLPDGEDRYVLAVYINDYSQNSSPSEDAVPEQVSQMTNKINELFGSTVADPNQPGNPEKPVPMGNQEGAASEQIIGGADGPTAVFSVTETNAGM